MKKILHEVLTKSIIERIKNIKKSRERLNILNNHTFGYYVFDYKDTVNFNKIKIEKYYTSELSEFKKDLYDLGYKEIDHLLTEDKVIQCIYKDMSYHTTTNLEIKNIWVCDNYDITLLKVDESYTYGKRNENKGSREIIVAIYKKEYEL